MSNGHKPAGKTKRSPVVPSRGTEVTLVADFPRPKAWGKRGTKSGDAAEIAVLQAGGWHPTTDDFMQVANVPNTGHKGKPLTEIIKIKTMGEFLGAILGTGAGGKPTRPKHSIKRLNLISHGIGEPGREPLYGLSGEIKANGDCFLNLSVPENGDPNAPMASGGIDQSVLQWLNGSAKSIRDECRERFREDGEIGLILCNGAGAPLAILASLLMPEMGKAFNVRMRGYDEEIVYDNTFNANSFVSRDLTRIKSQTQSGIGYFCAVPVAKPLAGLHLKFTKDIAKPKTPKP